jgi:[ribosomal protein S5]-alanine N-acetyltransferase
VTRGLKTPLVLTRCTIRQWCAEDAVDLARQANDTGVAANLRDAFPNPYTVDDANIFLARVINDQPMTNFCLDIGASAAGGIGLRLGSDIYRRTAEFGYWLGRAYWNRGIMSEAVGAFSDAAFEAFDLRRLYAEPFANNTASVRVLEKAGFILEARLKNNVMKAGQLLDSFVYAKTC